MIKSLYSDYFQKSKTFLYPLLLIPRGTSVTPISTHVSWEGHYDVTDYKFIAVYHLRSDQEFKAFEKSKLLNNLLFHEFYESSDNTGVYVFDYQDYKEDFDKFIHGKYSAMSNSVKSLILSHYSKSKKYFVYVNSFLYPELYYDIYSVILNCDKKILEEVVELCDKPDLSKEKLELTIKTLELRDFDLTSS